MNSLLCAACQTPGALRMKYSYLVLLAIVVCAGLPAVNAQSVITLGSARSFGVLGTSTVTNTGATVVNGNFGVSPGTAYTGFPPGVIVNGAIYAADATAAQARADATTAYNVLVGESLTTTLSGQDLGSRTLTTGVYFYSGAAQLTGTLVLDAQNNPNARFDFQIGSTLTTASSSQITLLNGAQAANIYCQVGTSATLGSGTVFFGTLLAHDSISLNTGASVSGGAFGLNAAVTLDTNTVNAIGAIPEPSSTALFAAVAGLGLAAWRRRRVASLTA